MSITCGLFESARAMGPMMAVSLTVCLSYIHLERFRHRTAVRSHAKKCHDLHQLQIGNLRSLYNWKFIANVANEPSSNNEKEKGEPMSWAIFVYFNFFNKELDRKLIYIGAMISFFALLSWTGCLTNRFSCDFLSDLDLALTYWTLFSFILLPSIFADLGHRVVDRMKESIDFHEKEIEKQIKAVGIQKKAQQVNLSPPLSSP